MHDSESIYAYVTVQLSTRSPELAQARIRELLDTRARQPSGARVRLHSQLGAVIAQAGNWREAVPIVYQSCTNAAATVDEWQLAVAVLGLAGETELRDRAFLLGIARFAGGSDPETCRSLAASLVHGPVSPTLLPLLREMLDHAKEGPVWSRVWTLLPSAMLEYRVGRYPSALQIADEFRRETVSLGLGRMEDNEPALAAGWFLTACAEARLDHLSAAWAAYREGRRLMPEASMREGTPSAYKYFGTWQAASDAELLRREAVLQMGGPPPDDPPVRP